ncbi:sodium/glutamate symporter [Thorsellia kenyensis]|uniref:Sodium/glutamate symporter n=1 Tax=Thorsellia kenyensis TaxID=1549888 RepID=A0ABV6C9F6_9GAMM
MPSDLTLISVDNYTGLVAAGFVLILGRKCVKKIGFLNRYSIPEAVAGGLVVAFLITLLRTTANVDIQFNIDTLQNALMFMFFATVGLNADLRKLATGGSKLGIFVVAILGLLILQNLLGISLASLFGLDPHVGLLAASITLSGGHATANSWGDVFSNDYNITGAKEIAIACATFGLVMGGIIGGPVARYLVKKTTTPDGVPDDELPPSGFENPQDPRDVSTRSFTESIILIAICLSIGSYISSLITPYFKLPAFVAIMLMGVLLRNVLSVTRIYNVIEKSVSIIGNVSLSFFLAMAVMRLRLWEILDLALPVLIILAAQGLLMALYAVFITFRIMGKNYDAAVLAGGHCGFGLGATPTAIANMQAVTKIYGPSHIAFFIVPLVGAFLVDFLNVLVIKGSLVLITLFN